MLRNLRGLKFDTVAVPLADGDFSIRSSKLIFRRQESCNANLHLTWSFLFRCRQGHGG